MSPARRVGRALRGHPLWSTLVVVVVLAGAAAGVYFGLVAGSSTPAAAATVVRTDTVSTGTIRQSVSASGTLAPAENESLSFSSAGVVTAVKVAEGQTVTKGQALATINSASLAATVAQAEATVASDQARVDTDETDDVTSTQLAADEAAAAAAQNQLASAKTALAGATLTSPISGVVAAVNLTVGQSVSGSSSGGSGSSGSGTSSLGSSSSSSSSSAQVQVISANTWIVNATVDATSVGLIKAGDQAQLTITGATGTVYGTISSVAVLSSSSEGTASYAVVISVTGAQTGLHDGASVTASLIYKQLTNVVEVPALALHRDTGGGEYVEKMVNGKPVKTTVQVGISSGTETQITSGLVAGDQIQVQQFTGTGTGTGTRSTTGTTNRTGTTGNFPGGGNFGGGNFGGGGTGFGGFQGGGGNGN